MRTKLIGLAVLAGMFALLATTPVVLAQPPVLKPACDRACLEKYIDRYLDAMLAHKVSSDLFAREVKFTENGVELPLGHEGLWFSMSGKGTYKFYVPDVETQQVAFIGTVKEGGNMPGAKPSAGTTVAVAIRLRIVDGLITEAEQLAIRPDQSQSGPASTFPATGEAVEKMGAPHKIFTRTIPEAERMSRADLVETANYYFTGLQRNDGKGYYPFTDDCDRYENGMQSTNVPTKDPVTGETVKIGCKKQFEENLKGIVSRVRDRRFVAVDRERGIVFAFGFFDHENINWTWQLAELFRIEKGQIRRIEAVFHRCPYGMNSGWSTYEQGMSDKIQDIR